MDKRSKTVIQKGVAAQGNNRGRNDNIEGAVKEDTAAAAVQQMSATESKLMRRSLHDMDEFKSKKLEQSSPFFRTTRVQTCSHVMMKNGKAIAVAFPLEKTGWKNPNSYGNSKRSSENESWSK